MEKPNSSIRKQKFIRICLFVLVHAGLWVRLEASRISWKFKQSRYTDHYGTLRSVTNRNGWGRWPKTHDIWRKSLPKINVTTEFSAQFGQLRTYWKSAYKIKRRSRCFNTEKEIKFDASWHNFRERTRQQRYIGKKAGKFEWWRRILTSFVINACTRALIKPFVVPDLPMLGTSQLSEP